MQTTGVTTLLNGATATGAGGHVLGIPVSSFSVTGSTSAGEGSATVLIEVSNDLTTWMTLGTIELELSTTAVSEGFGTDVPWGYVRANCTAITGTGAAVSAYRGA
jgi:hypothetical protein